MKKGEVAQPEQSEKGELGRAGELQNTYLNSTAEYISGVA
jgi:hypothetical protein